jgi:hypothetical protein
MAKLHELQSQIDQGKTAILLYQDRDGDNIKVFISQGQKLGQYKYRAIFVDRPNPFPEPQTVPLDSWRSLLTALSITEAESDQWGLE